MTQLRKELEDMYDRVQEVGGVDNLSMNEYADLLLLQEEVQELVAENDAAAMDYASEQGTRIIDDYVHQPYPIGTGVDIGNAITVYSNGCITRQGSRVPQTQHTRTRLMMVRFMIDNQRKWYSVAHMVLDAFGTENQQGNKVLFRDYDTSNCHIDNLRYIRGENEEDSI